MGLREKLTEKLNQINEFPKEMLQYLPTGFQELNHRAILNLNPLVKKFANLIAEEIHQIVPNLEAIWNRTGAIQGPFREPTGLDHLWGDLSSEIIVRESGIQYKFDFTKIMFAKGNVHERSNMPERINNDEIIFDMFAGIGYFTLGMGKSGKPKHIYAFEWNPNSFHYLQENIRLNKIEQKVTPIFGDCKVEVPRMVAQGILPNRIIMGLLPAPIDAIPTALIAIHPEGTIVLYEGVEPKESTQLFDEFSEIAQKNHYSTQLLERRIVKSYAPKLFHTVVEIMVKKNNP